MTPPKKSIAIVTPVFNEEENLPLYQKSIEGALLSNNEYDFRILFIDDGSRDKSWQVIREICSINKAFQGIRLSRNYGAHIALSAGFANIEADAIATLACDLQDPPKTIKEFIKKWEGGTQIVWGKRKKRADAFWKKTTSRLFYKLLQKFALPSESQFTTGSFLLVDKMVATAFNQFHEQNRITFALVAWTGFKQATVEYERKDRKMGKSGWTFSKMIKTMYDAFIGFSFAPIRVITLLGLSTSAVSFLFAV